MRTDTYHIRVIVRCIRVSLKARNVDDLTNFVAIPLLDMFGRAAMSVIEGGESHIITQSWLDICYSCPR